MSNPKEKAKELLNKYCALHFEQKRGSIIIDLETAKQCALIAIDEILNVGFMDTNDLYEYWHQVKQEIQNL